MANSIFNPSYFMKRLRDNGYTTFPLFKDYRELDPRRWTVIICPSTAAVFCTCCENKEEPKDKWYELCDSNQFIPGIFVLKTNSLEIFVERLHRFNIQPDTTLRMD